MIWPNFTGTQLKMRQWPAKFSRALGCTTARVILSPLVSPHLLMWNKNSNSVHFWTVRRTYTGGHENQHFSWTGRSQKLRKRFKTQCSFIFLKQLLNWWTLSRLETTQVGSQHTYVQRESVYAWAWSGAQSRPGARKRGPGQDPALPTSLSVFCSSLWIRTEAAVLGPQTPSGINSKYDLVIWNGIKSWIFKIKNYIFSLKKVQTHNTAEDYTYSTCSPSPGFFPSHTICCNTDIHVSVNVPDDYKVLSNSGSGF